MIDGRDLRAAFGQFPTGVCIVTLRTDDGGWAGMTVNSFSSVSLDPPLIVWSLRRESGLREAFHAGAGFVVNVLADDGEDLARRFAAPEPTSDALPSTQSAGILGERLCDSLVSFDCRTRDIITAGDHEMLLGEVMNIKRWRETRPLGFAQGQFCQIGGAAAPGRAAAG